MNHQIIRFYIGTDKDDKGVVVAMPGRKRRRVEDVAVELFGGVTSYYGRGGWINDDDVPVFERCLIIEIVRTATNTNEDRIAQFAERARSIFKQESVLYTITPTISVFHTAQDVPVEQLAHDEQLSQQTQTLEEDNG